MAGAAVTSVWCVTQDGEDGRGSGSIGGRTGRGIGRAGCWGRGEMALR